MVWKGMVCDLSWSSRKRGVCLIGLEIGAVRDLSPKSRYADHSTSLRPNCPFFETSNENSSRLESGSAGWIRILGSTTSTQGTPSILLPVRAQVAAIVWSTAQPHSIVAIFNVEASECEDKDGNG